ncbi:MAG: hypothetical protein HY842_12855 [Bacteroidetes bacterium]|nr:hypothetical protein [Bacteroidota bacterium]
MYKDVLVLGSPDNVGGGFGELVISHPLNLTEGKNLQAKTKQESKAGFHGATFDEEDGLKGTRIAENRQTANFAER